MPELTGTPLAPALIPQPVSLTAGEGAFNLSSDSIIYVQPATAELTAIGHYLADKLRPSTGYALPVEATDGPPPAGHLYLTTMGSDEALGEEGYELSVTEDGLVLVAYLPAGLFRGLQTIRQLLPPAVERATSQEGPWPIPAVAIRDYPRFPWRGVMLDVARHFFSVADVKRYIDLAAYYKINRFHLHLSDDQGWRIMINAWPNLATHGGSSEVGGGPGGYYSQAEYSDIVAYAESRYITIIPEIDMPGHTNAALASYPELNCNGVAPDLYSGTNVGFSSLCIDEEITLAFVDGVVRELAALTPGPYLHIGGDEAQATDSADYVRFIQQVQEIVHYYGKEMIGWEEIARAPLRPTTIIQHWHNNLAQRTAQHTGRIILSPATRTYLDMKYDHSTELGLTWAATIEVADAYQWEPAEQLPGIAEEAILGVEAPLWSETLRSMEDLEFMAFPRLPGLAEIGWSPRTGRTWEEYRLRLGAHGPRLEALEVNFYRSPAVLWQSGSN